MRARHLIQRAFYLAALFVAGLVTGFLLARSLGPHHPFSGGPPDRDRLATSLCEQFRSELKLTPEQAEKLGPIVDRRLWDMETIYSNTLQQIEAGIRNSDAELIRVLELSPDQCARLAELDRRRREMFQQKGPPPPPPPPGR